MWRFASNAFESIRIKKPPKDVAAQASSECSDDEMSTVSKDDEERLECPICWESFNIVENIPYVLWCGHTLCRNCVLGLQPAVLKLSNLDLNVPFFISCPWCHLLSLRLLLHNGNLKFPRKNYFLLWMVESLNGERKDMGSLENQNHQSVWSPRHNDLICTQDHSHDHSGGSRLLLYKSLDFFINFTSKFPYMIVFLVIVFFVIPGSVVVLALYVLLTIVLAIPSCLVLYFAFPVLERLLNEITS